MWARSQNDDTWRMIPGESTPQRPTTTGACRREGEWKRDFVKNQKRGFGCDRIEWPPLLMHLASSATTP